MRYSVISGFLGQLKDRFVEYQPSRSLEEMLEMASQITGCEGMEMVYPQDFEDPVTLGEKLADFGLDISAVNLNLKSEEKWRYGSISSPDPEVRREAVSYIRRAMDCAAQLGCNLVTTALLNDGGDYPFEIDYERAFNDALEAVKEGSGHRRDVRLSLEYKASEPRTSCLLNNAGKMAYFCELVGRNNVGVTMDVGHALQCRERPADSVSFLGTTGKLFYVHINDNYRDWDWDLVPGTVNFWDYLELAVYLEKVGYGEWITADVFPQRHDPVRIMEKTFEWMDMIFKLAEKIDEEDLTALQSGGGDAFDIADYVLRKTGISD